MLSMAVLHMVLLIWYLPVILSNPVFYILQSCGYSNHLTASTVREVEHVRTVRV